ncbi:unnamed protein product [Soboliphyme baturini]|uniref:Solute carrier organic anion transporter family member n=1 Tax=Soboliphyme baturini TaxID=241478 RepID=A0A183ISU9_9BILA|nr:unnamed protein product [Soboliphyme baturini]
MVINGLVPASITTLEKKFGIRGGESGLYSSMYDISVVLALFPVCYFGGGRGSKSRWLGTGVFVMGLGSFVSTLPQFFSPAYDLNGIGNDRGDVCEINSTRNYEVTGPVAVGNGWYFYFVLLLGQLLHGIGASPLYTLGISYLDENAPPRYSALYIGIYYACSTVGAAIGFVLGGFFLNIYGDVDKVQMEKYDPWRLTANFEAFQHFSITIQSSHSKWYGAWWIGYLITGFIAMLISVPLASFGKELPEAKENNNHRIDQANLASKLKIDVKLHEDPKALPKLCLGLLSNFTFTCLMIRECVEALLLNGFTTFIPKIIQNSFSMSASSSSMITGLIIVPFAVVGSVLGGYLVSRLNLKCRGIILVAAACHFVSTVFIAALLVSCPEQRLVGVDIPYENNFTVADGLLSSCNRDCHCDSVFNPVCDKNSGNIYFSPCYAGCLSGVDEQISMKNASAATVMVQMMFLYLPYYKIRLWNQCQCVPPATSETYMNQTVVEGLCSKPCSATYLFFALIALHTIAVFMTGVASQQAILRCVPFDQRTVALSLNWLFVRLLGCIPGPVIIGLFIDSTCLLWETTNSSRSCLQFDDSKMRGSLFIFGKI